MALRDLRAWTYTTDQGIDYAYGVAKYISDQVNGSSVPYIGGTPAIAALDTLPRGIKVRTATVVNAAGVKRRVVCMEKTAILFSTPGTIISLKDGGGVESDFTLHTTSGERNRKRTPGV